ncbi:MAG: hypothetical protein QM722_17015 [Piscinibacter sp.]
MARPRRSWHDAGEESGVMGNPVWWLVVVLAVACVLLLVALLRRPREPRPAPRADPLPAVQAPAAGPGAASVQLDPPAPGGGLAPLPAPASPARLPVAALVAPPVVKPPPTTLVVARSRRYELRDASPQPLLRVERAQASAWQRAPLARLTPMQREALAAALVHAPLLAPGAEPDDLFALTLRAGSALALARGELAAALRTQPPLALDAAHGAPLAAIVLSARCGPVYLRSLRSTVAALQADTAELLRQPAPGDERLRALLLDLSRYLREVEENHAGVIRKPVFVARVADFCVQAETQWRAAGDAAGALRSRLQATWPDAAARPGASGEWRALWEAYALRQAVACASARVLTGWHALRLALGEAVPAATLVLRGALQSLRSAAEADAALAGTVVPDSDRAQRELQRTLQAIDAGFAGEPELTLLLRLDSLGRVDEVRGPLAAE